MPDFREDFAWQMQFVPLIRNIVGPLLVVPSTLDIDRREATDMIVLLARDMRIGCRIRRPGYVESYGWEFTIRSRRDSGARTELDKILLDGWGDALFYAHAPKANDGGPFTRWLFVDLAHFRGHMSSRERRAAIKWGEKSNGDGTYFYHFDVRSFLPDPPILIAQSHQWAEAPPPSPVVTKPNGSIGPLFDW